MRNFNEEKFFYTPSIKLKDALNVWFSFPAVYDVGMSALGYLHLFRLLDELDFVNVERIFSDSDKTKIPKTKLDLISFSFSFEFDFLNIFKMLEKNNIPIRAEDRDDTCPLIMGGGVVLTANPKPFEDMFDFITLGDGEEITVEIAKLLYEHKSLSKEDKLQKLAELDGCYVPAINSFDKIKRKKYKAEYCVSSPIITPNTAFSDTFLIEVTRGCPHNCNFCLTSHINNPTHYAPYEKIVDKVNIALEKCSNIGLLGALVPANPCFEQLCEYLINLRKQREFKVSIASLRADFITPTNIKMLTLCGQKTATIAVEAGSQKMRDFINKKLTDEQIKNAANICFENGLDGLKIYAIIGFPNETFEDIYSLMKLIKEIKHNKKLTLSVNSFVPKMFTPFAGYNMENIKSLTKKINFIKKECLKSGIALRFSSLAWNELQGMISCGDKNLFPALYCAYKNGGSIGSFKKAFRKIS